MNGHIFHFNFVFVVCSGKIIAELSHLASKVATPQGNVDVHTLVIDAPASLIGDRRHVFEKVEVDSSQTEG